MNQADGGWTDTGAASCDTSATLFVFLKSAAKVQWRVEEELRAQGLSAAKFDVLLQLVKAGEPLPLRILAEGQNCVPSNMTTLVDRLEADGLVRRVDDPSDRRSKRAQLTPEGELRARQGAETIHAMNARFDELLGVRGQDAIELMIAKLESF
jgi:DNA-binding MarR family transcriptional regulator